MRTLISASLLSIIPFGVAHAQAYKSCDLILRQGIKDINTNLSARHSVAYKWHSYCGIDFKSASDSDIASASAAVFGVASGSGGFNSTSERKRLQEWCDENSEFAKENVLLFEEAQKISTPSINSFNQCIELTRKGVMIDFSTFGENSEYVHFSIDSTQDANLLFYGVKQEGYECDVQAVNTEDSSPVPLSSHPELGNANIQIDCKRNPPKSEEANGAGTIKYDPGYISINTSGPSFSIGFPKVVSQYYVTPPRSVIAFDSDRCPNGWTEYDELAGKVIVGVGKGKGLSKRELHDTGGKEVHSLTVSGNAFS